MSSVEVDVPECAGGFIMRQGARSSNKMMKMLSAGSKYVVKDQQCLLVLMSAAKVA
jgi:hypothetical protein